MVEDLLELIKTHDINTDSIFDEGRFNKDIYDIPISATLFYRLRVGEEDNQLAKYIDGSDLDQIPITHTEAQDILDALRAL